MPNETLIKYIKDGLAAGRTEDVLRSMLTTAGWTEKDVNEAFDWIKGGEKAPQMQPVLPAPASAMPRKKSSRNPFSPRGRIGRLRYFLSSLILSIVTTVLAVAVIFFSFSTMLLGIYGFLGSLKQAPSMVVYLAVILLPILPPFLLGLLFLYLSLTFASRRFQDLNRSGWRNLLLLIPFVNIYIALELLLVCGTDGPNRFGDDPLPPGRNHNDFLNRLGKSVIFKIIVTILIVILSVIVNIRDQANKQTAEQSLFGSLVASSSVESSAELAIPEWGIQFQKPIGMDDLEYAVSGKNGDIVYFSTQKLQSLDKQCTTGNGAVGALSRSTSPLDGSFSTSTKSQIGSYYYYFTVPNGMCSLDKQALALQQQQSGLLMGNILSTLQNTSSSSDAPITKTNQTAALAPAPAPASLLCSYEDATYIGVIFRASFPSYLDPSIIEVPFSGGNDAIISRDISKGLYCVKVRRASVDGIFFAENKKNGSAAMAVLVNPQKGKQYVVSTNTTAIGLMFLSPYFSTSDPAKAQTILAAIANAPGISSLAQSIETNSDYSTQLGDSNSEIAITAQGIAKSALTTLTSTSTASNSPVAIRVTAPSGSDTWSASSNAGYTITWESIGIEAATQAKIYLYFPDGTQCNIGSSPIDAGWFDLILPSQGCAGSMQKPVFKPGRYSVAIIAENADGSVAAAGQSNWFNIIQ